MRGSDLLRFGCNYSCVEQREYLTGSLCGSLGQYKSALRLNLKTSIFYLYNFGYIVWLVLFLLIKWAIYVKEKK